jgi:hypothetical protein
VAGYFEHNGETSGSIKDAEFLDKLIIRGFPYSLQKRYWDGSAAVTGRGHFCPHFSPVKQLIKNEQRNLWTSKYFLEKLVV